MQMPSEVKQFHTSLKNSSALSPHVMITMIITIFETVWSLIN